MTPSVSLLVHIFSPAFFKGKPFREFPSFLGRNTLLCNTLLGWRAFMSTLNIILKIFSSNARRSHFESCVEMLKIVVALQAMIVFLCFVA